MTTEPAVKEDENHYDAIVIGSGMGGLTTASLLAQIKNYRVLVLEKHGKTGGFTHMFKRPGGYEWDVGLHYIGQMHKGSPIRAIFDYLTKQKVQWSKMGDPFEVFCYPGFQFGVVSCPEKYKESLISNFPEERLGIEDYFRLLPKAAGLGVLKALPPILQRVYRFVMRSTYELGLKSTQEVLNGLLKSEKLKALLVSQWGDYGLAPEKSNFYIHAAIVTHYLNGGYYPVGGSRVIGDTITEIVNAHGGKIIHRANVQEIVLENRKAIGVIADIKGESRQFYAPEIYSDIGAKSTYLKLLPSSYSLPFRAELESEPAGPSAVTLYLGLKESPASLGVHGQNFWIFDNFNHNEIVANNAKALLEGKPLLAYLSFASLKNPMARTHTAEIISVIDYEQFLSWKNEPWKKRGTSYEQLKERISSGLLNLVERELPGFSKLVDYKELSTPLSVEHFTSHPSGQIYGTPAIAGRFEAPFQAIKTPVPNLYLVGADSSGHGIAGAMFSGLLAVGKKHGFMSLFRALWCARRDSNP